jgi:hypothetical protein
LLVGLVGRRHCTMQPTLAQGEVCYNSAHNPEDFRGP